MAQNAGPQQRAAQTLKLLIGRFTFMLLVVSAFGIMLLGKADTVVVDKLRATAIDLTAPVLDALSRPAGTVSDLVDQTRAFARVYEDNIRLREQNRRLLYWQQAARALERENAELKKLLNYVDVTPPSYISARVVGDMGGAFAHSLMLNAGRRDGVRKGFAVIDDAGLVGRVADVGYRGARVLLVTDINSRIPVQVESTRNRAILAGDNTDRPLLTFVPPDAQIAPGDRIVTSGHGGAFPPGIPIGVVTSVTDTAIRVDPYIKRHRLQYVRVVDYGLQGILDDVDARPDVPAGAAGDHDPQPAAPHDDDAAAADPHDDAEEDRP